MNYRCAEACLAAAGLMLAAPLTAQTTDIGTTTPPRDPQAQPQPQPTVSPGQVIGVIKGLIKPKPSPVVFPTPTPAPTTPPALTPAAAPVLYPAPRPRPVATTAPVGTVRPTPMPIAQPSTVSPLPSAAASITQRPLATVAEPVPETAVALPAPAPADMSGPPHSPTLPWGLLPWWAWLIVAGAAGGLAELARRWFWPKPTIGCEIAVGPGALTHAASPAFTAPEIKIAIRIEPGEASAPICYPTLVHGDTA